MSKFTVYVLSTQGWIGHGKERASEAQAKHVARLLAKRLGWTATAATEPPPTPEAIPETAPAPEFAGLSPIWKDPVLAAKWEAAAQK